MRAATAKSKLPGWSDLEKYLAAQRYRHNMGLLPEVAQFVLKSGISRSKIVEGLFEVVNHPRGGELCHTPSVFLTQHQVHWEWGGLNESEHFGCIELLYCLRYFVFCCCCVVFVFVLCVVIEVIDFL